MLYTFPAAHPDTARLVRLSHLRLRAALGHASQSGTKHGHERERLPWRQRNRRWKWGFRGGRWRECCELEIENVLSLHKPSFVQPRNPLFHSRILKALPKNTCGISREFARGYIFTRTATIIFLSLSFNLCAAVSWWRLNAVEKRREDRALESRFSFPSHSWVILSERHPSTPLRGHGGAGFGTRDGEPAKPTRWYGQKRESGVSPAVREGR